MNLLRDLAAAAAVGSRVAAEEDFVESFTGGEEILVEDQSSGCVQAEARSG
jgi:hypothetical protein